MQIIKRTLAGSFFILFLLAAGCGTIAPKAATDLSRTTPAITLQPASRTVTAGQPATFSVVASGAPTLTYQWRKNGTLVSGATLASYTTAPTTASDKGAQFTVVVKNSAGSVTSSPALLTVSSTGPLVLSASISSLNFGDVSVATISRQPIILTNSGGSDVTISQVLVAGAGFNSTASNGLILTPGQSTTLTSTFAPPTSGAATGKVTVSSNAANSPAIIFLSGKGVPAVAHSVALSWSSAVIGVERFNAYVSTVAGGPFVKLSSTPLTSPSYTDNGVQSGTYYYVVTALNASNEESRYSSEVSAIVP